jgi:hypothetical protein
MSLLEAKEEVEEAIMEAAVVEEAEETATQRI